MPLELPNWMVLFNREPVSAALVRADRVSELDHLALEQVRIATFLFEALLELGPALYASQLQYGSSHSRTRRGVRSVRG